MVVQTQLLLVLFIWRNMIKKLQLDKWVVNYRPSRYIPVNLKKDHKWKTKSVTAYGSLDAVMKICESEKLDPRVTEFSPVLMDKSKKKKI